MSTPPSTSSDPVPDFWRSSGHHLLEIDADGWLRVSDDFLRAYLLRPELIPVEESCAEELRLHHDLLEQPRLEVATFRLERLADPDARDNYRTMLRFRDQLLGQPTIEAAYLDLVRGGLEGIPPLFLDQLAHVILRHALDGCTDPFRLRAAELLFREQRVTIEDGAIMLADEETVAMHASGQAGREHGSLGRLLLDNDMALRNVELDVMDETKADAYWQRSDRFDWVLDLGFTRPGLDALCRVLEIWVQHFTGLQVGIQPVRQISDQRWVWHLGLDVEASRLLNDLYDGREVDEARRARLLSLFRLEFRNADAMLARLRGRPVYLGLAMTEAKRVKLKPQNLLLNLPFARAA
jgi:Family of unknown function (DUF6352)